MHKFAVLALTLLEIVLMSGELVFAAAAFPCSPTAADSLGPFYKPDAPRRSSVGQGYVLTGTVQSAADCTPIAEAKIEFWLANPAGVYDDQHRAALVSEPSGAYRFESNPPPDYDFRPPHIHMRVSAAGFKPLVTQHYPGRGASQAKFDIVLIPAD